MDEQTKRLRQRTRVRAGDMNGYRLQGWCGRSDGGRVKALKRDAINQLLSRFVCFSPRLVLMGFATVEAEGYCNPRTNVFYSCGLTFNQGFFYHRKFA